ncbi:tape measure protein [Psychromonas sp. MME2]|uniref:tape measure protein n=1 Tax=Psychromonas sp. MME2 TaxID=3231033 RepID=UPI00339C3E76
MSNLSLSLNIDTRTTGSESLKKLSGLIDELGEEAQHTHGEAKQLGARINELEQQKGAIASFRSLKKELGETTARLEQAKAKATALGREMGETDKPTKALSKSFNDAKKKLTALKTAEQQQTQSLQAMRGQLEQSGIKTNQLNNAQKQLAIQLRATDQWAEMLSNELEHQKRTLDKTATSTEKLTTKNKKTNQSFKEVTTGGKGFNGQLNKITTGLVAAGAAYVGINTVTGSIKDLLATGGKFEKLDTQMRGIMGSIEAGDKATEWVKDFAKNTPLQLDGVTKAFIKAKAYGLDPMDGTLQALTDSVSKLGGGQEELEGVVLAVGQAWSKQKLQAEEVNQLVERGIPVWSLLETALGKTTAELQKMSEKGQIGRKEMKLLIDEMAKSSAGSAKAMMTTWDGIVSNLYDNIDKVKNTIAKAGLLDTFKAELSGISTAIDEMAADGSLQTYAKEISDAIVGTLKTLKNGLVTVYEWREELATLAKVVLGIKLASMFGGFVSSAATATTALAGYSAGLLATASSAKAFTLSIGGIGLAIAAGHFAITEVTKYLIDYDKSINAAKESQARLVESNKEVKAKFAEFSEQVGITIKDIDQLDQLIEQGVIAWDNTANAYVNVANAAKAKADAIRKARQEEKQAILDASPMLAQIDAISTAITNQVSAIETAASSNKLGEWAEQFFIQFNPASIEQVATLTGTLDEINSRSDQLGNKLQSQLIDKLKDLTGTQLLAFQQSAHKAFEQGHLSADELSDTLTISLSSALKKVAVDAQVVNGEFTDMGVDIVNTFDAIVSNANASSAVIKTAFNAALNKVSTQADLNELSTSWENYAKSAKLSADELALGLLETKVKAQDLTCAYDLLGITSAEKLALTAERHKQAYEQIKIHSANTNDHKLAVLAWAEAEIEAATAQGRSVDQSVVQQAAILGVTLEIDKQNKALNEQGKQLDKNRDKYINRAAASKSIVDAAVEERNATKDTSEAVKEGGDIIVNVTNRTVDASVSMAGAFMAVADQADLTQLSIGGLADKIEELEGRIYQNRQVHSEWFSDMARDQIVLDQQSLKIARQTKTLRELEQALGRLKTQHWQ